MTELVTAVVCTAFDDAGDRAVLTVRDRVIAAGVRVPACPRHRPHLTLAAVRLHPAQLPDVVQLVRDVADAHAPFPLVLDRVGTFHRAGALWLGPHDVGHRGHTETATGHYGHTETATGKYGHTETATGKYGLLRTLHRSVHAAVENSVWPSAFRGRTEPDAWVPHCSLATRLDVVTLERLKVHVEQGFQPVEAEVSGLAVVLVGGSGDVALAPLIAPTAPEMPTR